MTTKLSRRKFLAGSLASLGAGALGGRIFAAPAGWKPAKKPNLVFGILSDTHLMVEWDGKSLYRTMTFDYVHNAFKLFKSRGIDAFVHLGDAAHRGCVREWEFHRELFDKVFGKSGGPEKLIVVGNHELFGGSGHCKGVYRDPKAWQENAICADLPRHYERVWGEPYSEVFHKEVKGYHFFGRHWNDKEYDGVGEKPFADYILSHADKCSLRGAKPFFILSHRRHHFRFCSALREFRNAVAFMGHWHWSNADWKTIFCDTDTFGGHFPHIQIGSCRFDGGNGVEPFDDKSMKAKEDSSSWAGRGHDHPSRQAMLVNVYDDMVVFERHEVGEGGKLGPDWVMPLGWRTGNGGPGEQPHPFALAELQKAIGAPEFPRKAKLEVASAQVEVKNGKEDKKPRKEPGIRVSIPMADGNPDSRAFAYNVVVVGDDYKDRFFKSAFFAGLNSGIGHEPNGGVTTVDILKSQLPAGKKLTIAVRPVSSLGTKGRAIGTTMKM